MTSEQEEKDTMLLDYFQACLESNISDFAISKIEDLYDEDGDELVRAIWMERGTSQYIFCITPSGFIKTVNIKMPMQLWVQVANSIIMGVILACKPDEDEFSS